MRNRRHYLVPTRTLTWCSLVFTLVMLLGLVLVRQTVVRLWISAVAVPSFLWTGTLLRWRINGNLKEALTWSFLAGISGVAVWVFSNFS